MDKPDGPDGGSNTERHPIYSWRYLYRTDEGRIDAAQWRRAVSPLAGALAILTVILVFVLPYTEHNLKETPLLAPTVLGANLYVIIYTFTLIFIGICYYNLSAKRWRDLSRPPALAGLLPFLIFFAGAMHWLSLRVGGAMFYWLALIVDLCLALVAIWNVIELGGWRDRRRQGA